MEKIWNSSKKDGYILIDNKDGKELGISAESRAAIITKDGYAFKDFTGSGELLPYEDWRLTDEERAKDLAGRLSVEDIAGLMLYSAHQLIPAEGPLATAFGGTYKGKPYREGEVLPWELTDQQRKFISEDRVRHVLIMGLKDTETAVRWNNRLQALAENEGFGIPANNCSDPRHGAGSMAEYMGVTGENISKWANGVGLTAAFEPELVLEFGRIASREYRALGITTALSPQIDLATEPRWMRFADTFGEHTDMTILMTKAYCDGFQTTEESKDGWGKESVNTMVKHFPGGGPCEAGRDAHYAYGKYAVYPGRNFEEHLKPFTQGAFSLDGPTAKASAVMPYYSISYDVDKKYGENVGNAYNRFLINDLLREKMGYDGVVCTDWGVTQDAGLREETFAGKCWGTEQLTEAERHLKALEAGVDQFGGNSKAEPVLEAYRMGCKKYGEAQMRRRFEESAVRILLNIFRTGLFENPYLDAEESLKIVGAKEYVKKGYESQLKSITLLKNRKQVLPLKEKIKIYIPDRHIKPYLNFMSAMTEDVRFPVPAKRMAEEYFEVVESLEEADAAICFIESPISCGYSPADREEGGNGYRPVTLQYRPYQAVKARAKSIAGGDPLEDFTDRNYKDKWNTAANEDDLTRVIDTKKKLGEKPVIVSISMKNPMVLSEVEPYADAILVDYGVSPAAVLDIVTGRHVPGGLLPFQIPENMDTVEKQEEDVPFDMQCYRDTEGHVYDFAYGMDFEDVISDERVQKYRKSK